jgi:putative transposon-encoded protein
MKIIMAQNWTKVRIRKSAYRYDSLVTITHNRLVTGFGDEAAGRM